MTKKIFIAMHKPFIIPYNSIYSPIHVGSELTQKFTIPGADIVEDNTLDNISAKNPMYCELTALYWIWKNCDADIQGLVHYRRHLTAHSRSYCQKKEWTKCILSSSEIDSLFTHYDIVLPKKNKYYIETLYSHYAHTHDYYHLEKAKAIVSQLYPEYNDTLSHVYNQHSGYMCNIIVTKKEILNEYCKWLFPILFELEKHIDTSQMNSFEARYIGRVSEILLNVWVAHHKEYNIKELNVLNPAHVNWFNKIKSFLLAKFTNRKYSGSF